MNPRPTRDEAWQLALMVSAGMPSADAFRYFLNGEPLTALQVSSIHDQWVRSKEFGEATRRVQGKSWQEMTAEERIRLSVDKHYNEMAYFLYSNNYCDLTGADKSKADTCRTALEAKLAGTAGKFTPLDEFWNDMRAKLAAQRSTPQPTVLPA